MKINLFAGIFCFVCMGISLGGLLHTGHMIHLLGILICPLLGANQLDTYLSSLKKGKE